MEICGNDVIVRGKANIEVDAVTEVWQRNSRMKAENVDLDNEGEQ